MWMIKECVEDNIENLVFLGHKVWRMKMKLRFWVFLTTGLSIAISVDLFRYSDFF